MLKNPRGPKGIGIGRRLNLQSQNGEAGNRKTNAAEVRVFKQRIADGLDTDAARAGTKISERMAIDILKGRSWASILLLLALCTMGSDCDGGGRGSNVDVDRRSCWSYDYPLCSEVSSTYPCLCVSGVSAVTSIEDEQELYNTTPTPGYLFEGGPEGGETYALF